MERGYGGMWDGGDDAYSFVRWIMVLGYMSSSGCLFNQMSLLKE